MHAENHLEAVSTAISERVENLGLRVSDVLDRTAEWGTGGPIAQSTYHALLRDPERLAAARSATLHKLEHALEWEAGSIAAMFAGGEPTPIERDEPQVEAQLTDLVSELSGQLAENSALLAELARVLDGVTAEVRRLRGGE